MNKTKQANAQLNWTHEQLKILLDAANVHAQSDVVTEYDESSAESPLPKSYENQHLTLFNEK